MRHLKSFLLSLVLAPMIWALTGVGLAVHRNASLGLDAPGDTRRLVGLAALAGAGALVAVLAVGRLSPVGPALAGLAFLAAAGYAPALPGLLPELPMGLDGALLRPAEGYAVLIGVPLLATALSERRWRRPAAAPDHPVAPADPPAPADLSASWAAPATVPTRSQADPDSSWAPPAAPAIPAVSAALPNGNWAPPAAPAMSATAPPAALTVSWGDDATEDLTLALVPLRATPPTA